MVLLSSVASCEPRTSDPSAFTVHDSVGVTIVSNAAPAWADGEGWTLSPRPSLDIGGASSDPRYLFARVERGRILPGGDFVVINRGTNTLRRYSSQGALEWEAGGEGDGPSEFRAPNILQVRAPDTLLVFDTNHGRLSVFGPDGSFAGATPLRVPGAGMGFVSSLAFAADGSIVAFTSGSSPNTPEQGLAPGIRRPWAPAFRFDDSGLFRDTMAVLPGTEVSVTDVGYGLAVAIPPYAHITSYAVRGDDVVVGGGDHLEFEVWSPTGALSEKVRGPDPDLAVSDEDVAAYRQWYISRLPENQRAGAALVLDATVYPETKAVYSFVHSDPDGNVWLGAGGPSRYEPSSWIVFSDDGRLLGTVPFPERFRVLDFGSAAVLGVWRDEFDVEHVQLYAIEK